MHIFILESKDWDLLDSNVITRSAISRLLSEAGEEATKVLNYDSKNINVVFKPNLPYVRKDTGLGGSAFDSEMLDMTFNPTLPYGVDKFKEYLRDGMFHEINHVVHYAFQAKSEDILFWVVAEGLAVVFERTFAGADHPWNNYGNDNDDEMKNWLHDLRTAKDPNDTKWYTEHPDGRNNIAYKTGAWIVDRAIKNSGQSIIDLTRLSHKEIIALAKV